MIIDDEYYESLFLRENIIVFDVDDDVEIGEEVRDIVKKDSNILKQSLIVYFFFKYRKILVK